VVTRAITLAKKFTHLQSYISTSVFHKHKRGMDHNSQLHAKLGKEDMA